MNEPNRDMPDGRQRLMLWLNVVFAGGLVLIVVGAGLIWPPAAVVLAGLMMAGFAFLAHVNLRDPDWIRRRSAREGRERPSKGPLRRSGRAD